MITEADTCRKYVTPRLQAAGWGAAPHDFAEQRTFTDGRIHVYGDKTQRGTQRCADYLLRYTRNCTVAVLEAKAAYELPADGLQQAQVNALKRLQAESAAELDALLPAVSERAFRGEL